MAQNTKKINKKKVSLVKENKSHFFLFFLLALIICAGVIYALILFRPFDSKKADNSTETSASSEDKSEENQSEKETTEVKSTEIKPEAEKSNPKYEGEDPNNASSLTGIINYVGVFDGKLNIRVSIEQIVSGTCIFTLTSPSGEVITGSSAITTGPASAFCSFNTPANGLENGKWQISVSATSTDKHGIITGEGTI